METNKTGEADLLEQLNVIKKLSLLYVSAHLDMFRIKFWDGLIGVLNILILFSVIGGATLIGFALLSYSLSQLINSFISDPHLKWVGFLTSGLLMITTSIMSIRICSLRLKRYVLNEVRQGYEKSKQDIVGFESKRRQYDL